MLSRGKDGAIRRVTLPKRNTIWLVQIDVLVDEKILVLLYIRTRTEASFRTKSNGLQFPQSKISGKTMINCWFKVVIGAKPVERDVILADANMETK